MPSLFRSPNDPSSSGIDSSDTDHVVEESHKPSGTTTTEQPSGTNTGTSSHQLPGPLTRLLSSPLIELPNVTGGHLRGLLYTSFLYDKCRTEALESLNQRRDPANQLSKDDKEVFILSEQIFSRLPLGVTDNVEVPAGVMTGPLGAQIRAEYLDTFSKVVNNLASTTLDAVEPSKVPQKTILHAATLHPAGLNSRLEGATSSFAMQGQLGFHKEASPGLLTFGKSQTSFAGPKSQYASEYQELELLGKGGYGKVYKVRHHLDNQEYAVKKILITSQRLQKFLVKDQVEALLEEVRTLAKLNHTNVVRYFHCWFESAPPSLRPITPMSGRIDALETIPSQIEPSKDRLSRISDRILSEDVVSEISDRIMTDELSQYMEYGANQSMAQMLEEAQDRDDYYDNVVFAPTSRSGQSLRSRRASHATTSSIRTFQTSMLSVGEEEDEEIETIPRDPMINDHTPVSRIDKSSLKAPESQKVRSETEYQGTDVTLCIKMSLYPTTLSAYLFTDQSLSSNERGIHHCFHKDASICMLSCLLDGVQYLHSQKIIHRDLKPANIFLSIHHSMPPSLQGCFDMMACSQCGYDIKDKRVYITPCIGDFGLIAEMNTTNTTESIPSSVTVMQPKPVGTHFYRPTTMPKTNPSICPKLDVYSLGVIAFELVHKFDTKSERAIILTNLNKGALPKNFENHEMAEGIKAMVDEDRDRRWDCIAIREWFFGLQTELK